MNTYSNQDKVQTEIARIEAKKRRERSSAEKCRMLQLKLYDKAKSEKGYCFYILYDKVFQPAILEVAYRCVRANGGSPGLDGQTFEAIEKGIGQTNFLADLGDDLRKREYRPQAVKRVWIEKPGGGQRPLGIPTIRDRVAQMACKLVIEPIFESDFADHSFGFRPKRSAGDAMERIRDHLQSGHHEVYDADLSKYFDTIPHDKLMITLKERISDRRVLDLINSWLKAPVVEDGGGYGGGKKTTCGTPQGGVISPLLSNIYLNLLDRIVANPEGVYAHEGVKMIRYADDFILMGRELKEELLDHLHGLLGRMGLEINESKSHLVSARDTPFDFLGFTVRYSRSVYGWGRFWNIFPSKKSCQRVRQKIRGRLKRIGHYAPGAVAQELNWLVQGWLNYYDIAGVSHMQVTRSQLDGYLGNSLYRYYNRKSQRKSTLHGREAYRMLVRRYGLKKVYQSCGRRPMKALSRRP